LRKNLRKHRKSSWT